jgi:hypothetical protein
MAADITMSTEEKRLVTVQPKTAGGQDAPVDGAATFAVRSGTCTVVAMDALSAYVVSGDTPGDSVIDMSVDADLGAGVVPVLDTMLVHVTSATAASLEVLVGEPELKTA